MRPSGIHRLLDGGALDLVLAAFIAVLGLLSGARYQSPLGVLVDLAACTAAALAVRWPRAAGAALGAILLIYLSAPRQWSNVGEYAALIPVLGTGIRDQRRERLVLTVAYWLVLSVRQVRGYPDPVTGVLASLVWAMLFALMWLLGGAIHAFRRAEEQARIAALAQQRLGLARDLHDTVARSLTLIARRAHRAAAAGDTGQLQAIADEVGQAAGQLRWVLGALRDPDADPALRSGSSLARTVGESLDRLRAHGFPVTTTIDGDLDDVPAEAGSVLAEILEEAAANVERHGSPGRPCVLMASVDELTVDLALINEVSDETGRQGSARPLGLLGAAERLALVGGQLNARQEGTHWITHASIPIAGRR